MTALYLSDYAPEGGTESASAGLRAAFDALGAQGGGELVVDGTFLLDQNSIQLGEGASKNFNGLANTIVLRGQGSHSVLLLRAGASATALRISTIENLYIENVTFHGSPSAIPDVRKGIYLDGVRTATFIGCNFNAIVAGNGSGAAAAAICCANSGASFADSFCGCWLSWFLSSVLPIAKIKLSENTSCNAILKE